MKDFQWPVKEKDFFQNSNKSWKLQTMVDALAYLGNPEKKIENKVIHIAGTNGKGSVANYIKTVLQEAGYKVGLYTSPHLIEYNERIYYNNRYITDKEIEQYKKEILIKCKNVNDISFFEATTLIAIMMFSNYFNQKTQEQLDYCIFEVGLGGRLDATNVFNKSLVSVITSISFDHTKILGNTLSKIAYEKGGIIKKNVPVLTSNTKKNIVNTLNEIAKKNNTKLYVLGKDFKLDYNLKPSLFGEHQIYNATLAKEVCKYIGVSNKYITKGIANTKWPGRLQEINIKNINNNLHNIEKIYLDGAHNKDGIKQLCKFVRLQRKVNKNNNINIVGVMACLKRKDYFSFFNIIKPQTFNKLLFFDVPASVNDFVDTKELQNIATKHNITNTSIKNLTEIKNYIDCSKKNIIFIFGSLYFVGYILENYVENKNQ